MQLSSPLATGLILAVTSTAALADNGEWQASADPVRGTDGTAYCTMWSSEVSPAMVVTAWPEKPSISVYSQELGVVNDNPARGTLSFSSGRDYDLLFGVDDYDPSLLVAHAVLYGDQLNSVLNELVNGGKATFHIDGSVEVSFPLDGASERAMAFMACQKKL